MTDCDDDGDRFWKMVAMDFEKFIQNINNLC